MTNAPRELLLELSEPDAGVVRTLGAVEGDVLLLGAGGKMGLSLALMARRAFQTAGKKNRVIAASRFTSITSRDEFENEGIDTVICDAADHDSLRALPDAPNVVYMIGQKFGTAQSPGATWLTNTVVPALAMQRFCDSQIVAFSSGNIYPLTPVDSGGPTEQTPPAPVGEYGLTVLGRERIIDHFSRTSGTPVTIVRLNYANEPRYGVLVDIATKVLRREPVDVSMGHVNVLWATDANRATLRCFELTNSPPAILNVAGPQTLAVRDIAQRFGRALGVEPVIVGQESQAALLSNASECWRRFGPPSVSVDVMIERIAAWMRDGKPALNRPTHFEVRNGAF